FGGIMDRCGGIVKNNLFLNDSVAITYGLADGSNSTAGGVSGEITGNIILGDQGGVLLGAGINIGNTKPGATVMVQNNLRAGDNGTVNAAITLAMPPNTLTPDDAVGLTDTTFQNNIAYGWYRDVMIDGRFQPGGTGLYALNNMTMRNNDFVGSPNRLIRQDGRYSIAQEHWSGNQYYDTALSQSSWFLLLNNTISWKQWSRAFDRTAVHLSRVPYADPNRNAPTYDATLGGAGTLARFMATARQLSDTNYRPQYMAQAVIDYVRKGFALDKSKPIVAQANMPNISMATASATYQFTVTYCDDFSLNRT